MRNAASRAVIMSIGFWDRPSAVDSSGGGDGATGAGSALGAAGAGGGGALGGGGGAGGGGGGGGGLAAAGGRAQAHASRAASPAANRQRTARETGSFGEECMRELRDDARAPA